jgi:hypothetical protein
MKLANPTIVLIIAAALFAPVSDAVAQQPPAVGNSVITGGPHDLGNGNYGWNIKTSDGTEKFVVTNKRGGIRRYVNGGAPPQAYLPPPAPPPVFESNIVEPGSLPAQTYGIYTPGVPPIPNPTHPPGWVPPQVHGNNVPTGQQDSPAARRVRPAEDYMSGGVGGGAGFGLAGFGIYEIIHHNNSNK